MTVLVDHRLLMSHCAQGAMIILNPTSALLRHLRGGSVALTQIK